MAALEISLRGLAIGAQFVSDIRVLSLQWREKKKELGDRFRAAANRARQMHETLVKRRS